MQRFGHIAQRLFNVPLAIHPKKADLLMAALAEQLGMARPVVLNPGAFFDDDDEDFGGRRESVVDHGYDLIGPGENVALIPVRGTLVQKLGSLRPYSGMTGYNGIRQTLYAALSDPAVKSIVLDIDSPGGEVAGCFDLVDFIYEARGEKPIAAILTEKAYSAAYAIASAVDPGRIYVPRTGGTGSIGVICMHVDWSRALAENGIKVTYIHYGAKKVDGRPEIPLSDTALADLQTEIDAMGELFVDTVARNRGLRANAVRGTEAGTFLGIAGVQARLADRVLAPDAALQAVLADLA